MQRKGNPGLVNYARNLRRNMTKEEKHLWYDFLSTHQLKFTRQKVLGRYIADFYCAAVKLVIEVDGIQHATRDALAHDSERTDFLSGFGVTVLRIPNEAINNRFTEICNHINTTIKNLQDGTQDIN